MRTSDFVNGVTPKVVVRTYCSSKRELNVLEMIHSLCHRQTSYVVTAAGVTSGFPAIPFCKQEMLAKNKGCHRRKAALTSRPMVGVN